MNSIEEMKKILQYWLDVEYFTPQFLEHTVPKKNNLPWTTKQEDKNYCVYLGKIETNSLIEKIEQLPNGWEKSFEKANGFTSVCGFILDDNGFYSPDTFVVNPFFFAISKVISSKNIDTPIQDELLHKFNGDLNEYITTNFENCAINYDAIKEILDTIYGKFHYNDNKIEQSYYIDYKTIEKSEGTPNVDIMGSFYTTDIQNIIDNINSISNNDKIAKYTNCFLNTDENKAKRIDIIDENDAELKKWLEPSRFPMGKWPSKYSPSLMQQVAINIAISDEDDRNEKIFSVNGPPGTGKLPC